MKDWFVSTTPNVPFQHVLACVHPWRLSLLLLAIVALQVRLQKGRIGSRLLVEVRWRLPIMSVVLGWRASSNHFRLSFRHFGSDHFQFLFQGEVQTAFFRRFWRIHTLLSLAIFYHFLNALGFIPQTSRDHLFLIGEALAMSHSPLRGGIILHIGLHPPWMFW